MNYSKPILNGLILSGGKSTRMGSDKGLISYHGIPQRQFLYDLAEPLVNKVFFSIRSEQQVELASSNSYIIDNNEYKGPLNGILSAHKHFPDNAWLVLACDLPLINQESIQELISQRDINKIATAYATKESKLPEPLAAIWEPQGLIKAIAYMKTAGSSCPRKFLINSDVKLIFPNSDEVLYNANSPEEYQVAKSKVME